MISVVIPAFNEEKSISQCLKSLTHQKTSKKFEVIVVDNGSQDKTAKVVSRFNKKLNLRIIHVKQKGRGKARFEGFKKASGNLIFSTDADTTVPPDWIERLATALESKKYVAVTTPCGFNEGNLVRRFTLFVSQNGANYISRIFLGYPWLSGYSFCIKKSVYRKAGGFNPTLNAFEDVELSRRVARVGNILFLSNCRVTCSQRRFKNGILRGVFSYISFVLLFSRDKTTVLKDYR